MSLAPDINTLRQSVELLHTGNPTSPYLSREFVDFLFSINIDGQGILKDNKAGKSDILDLVSLVGIEGEDAITSLIEENKALALKDILRKSHIYLKARKQFFLATTSELKEKKKIASIVKCPKCRSNEVETKTVQIRAGDEASTDKNICRKCNYKFSIN